MNHWALLLLVAACGDPPTCEAPTDRWDDHDGDGYGDPATRTSSCAPLAGAVGNGDDCDDASASIHPGASDVCNALDDDCDGAVDPEATVWFFDGDGDGFGGSDGLVSDCAQPEGYVATDDDCDDAAATTHPGAPEACNGLDDDCDSVIDEDFDSDGDGHLSVGCGSGDDCDDADTNIHPGASDLCDDGIDADCVGGDPTCGALTGDLSLGDATTKIYAPGGHQEMGRLLDVGDVNGDGEVDVLAAAETLGGSGGAYVAYGPLEGSHVASEVGDALRAAPGTSYCGRSISLADVNDDGYDDVGLGAPYSNELFVEFGPLSGDVDLADASIHATADVLYFGHGHDMGDVDDDGVADLVIASYKDDTYVSLGGAILVEYGPLSDGDTRPYDDYDAAIWSYKLGLQLGRIVQIGGDFNGDGARDLMLHALSYTGDAEPYSGAAYVQFGPIVGDMSLDDVDAILGGETSSSWCGQSMAAADVDGDGLDDAAVGAPNTSFPAESAGAAYLVLSPFSGPMTLDAASAVIRGDGEYAYAGTSVTLGDTNGDGLGDLSVGVPGYSFGAGATLYYQAPFEGSLATTDATATIHGEDFHDQSGTAVLHADLDHDGAAELLVGSTFDATVAPVGGAFYVLSTH